MAYNNALKDMGSKLKSAVVETDRLHNKIKSLQQTFRNFRKQIQRKEKNIKYQKKMVVQLKADRKRLIKRMDKERKTNKKVKQKIETQMEAHKKLAARSKPGINQDSGE